MTKKERARLAKKARRWGHFNKGGVLSVACPLDGCKTRIETHRVSAAESVTKTLDSYVMDHLEDHHE